MEELADRSLELAVWDHDRMGHQDFLGGVRLNLGTGTALLHNFPGKMYNSGRNSKLILMRPTANILLKTFLHLLLYQANTAAAPAAGWTRWGRR